MTLRARLGLTMLLTAVPLLAGLAWVRRDLEQRSVEDRLREVAETHMGARGSEDFARDPAAFGGRLEGRRRGRRGWRGHRGPRGPRNGPGPERGERSSPGQGPPREEGEGWRGEHGRGAGRGPPRDGPPRDGPRRDGPPRDGPPRDGRARDGSRNDGPARDGRRGGPPPGRPRPPHETWIWAYGSDYVSANPKAPPFPASLQSELSADAEVASASFSRDGRTGHQLALPMLLDSGSTILVLVQRVGESAPSAVPDLILGGVILCAVLFLVVLLAAGPIVRRVRRLTAEVRRSAGEHYAVPVAVRGDDEIAGLARAFNEAGAEVRTHVEDLEEREKTLRGFVANTTHDVMIPLTVLQGHLSSMRKGLEGGEAVAPEQVVCSLEEAHYMASLIHNLSAAAKLEAGERHVQRHRVDLNAIVERVVARHRPMAEAREIQVDYAVPEVALAVEGDVTLLEQAVSNLVHNAVRYNDRGGHVAILLDARDEEAPAFSLRVIDDGPGMPADQLERLPERRFRGDAARSRHPEGLGLGLNIAWDVAERHGLTLGFKASEYGGLEAELRGPALPA